MSTQKQKITPKFIFSLEFFFFYSYTSKTLFWHVLSVIGRNMELFKSVAMAAHWLNNTNHSRIQWRRRGMNSFKWLFLKQQLMMKIIHFNLQVFINHLLTVRILTLRGKNELWIKDMGWIFFYLPRSVISSTRTGSFHDTK